MKPEYTILDPEHERSVDRSVSSIQIHEGDLDKQLWSLIIDMTANDPHLHVELGYSERLALSHSNGFSGKTFTRIAAADLQSIINHPAFHVRAC